MKFVITKKERLPDALRRVAGEQFHIAMDQISGTKPTATSVHSARKSIKRVRAVLRMVRCDANRAVAEQDDRALRDAAKLLAANRDLHVQAMALRKLSVCKNNGDCDAVWKRLRAAQQNLREHGKNDLNKFAKTIKQAGSRVSDWKIDDIDSRFIGDALNKSYRRAQKRFKRVCDVPTGEKLHCWRKTVKTFWHQLQLVDEIAAKKLRKFACDAERLAKVLGDEHDLFMLLWALADATDPHSRAVKCELRQLRGKLTKRALKLGHKTFALAPSAFHKRLSRYVK